MFREYNAIMSTTPQAIKSQTNHYLPLQTRARYPQTPVFIGKTA